MAWLEAPQWPGRRERREGSARDPAMTGPTGVAGGVSAYPQWVMAETTSERRPRRDADGRLATVGDLVGVALAGLVCGIVVLLVFEAILSATRLSEFGHTSGWLTIILPVWLFTEEFRAAGYGAYRIIVAFLGAGFGVAAGLSVAGLAAHEFPALVSGIAGAVTFTVVYCLVWFYGLRWLSHRAG